eukprot:351399-Pyramimonas_sp.AAC.1
MFAALRRKPHVARHVTFTHVMVGRFEDAERSQEGESHTCARYQCENPSISVRGSPPAAGPLSTIMGYIRVASVRLGAALAHLGTPCGGGYDSSAHIETL